MTATHVLVTGASGKLGQAVTQALVTAGYRVRATDVKYAPSAAAELLLGDLRDELFVYRSLEGCDAVVHLGNHPNAFAGPSAQRILAENTAMNANVFHAAVDLGVRDIVFASSIQVMLPSIGNTPPPYAIPYFPIDGAAPANPGKNTYALSKEFAERMLRLLCERTPELAATAVRFPMLPGGDFLSRLRERGRVRPGWLNLGEALAFLTLSDAARLVTCLLQKRRPGYRQYLPARAQEATDLSLPQLIERFYPDIPLRVPVERLEALIDVSVLEQELDWRPTERLHFTLDDT